MYATYKTMTLFERANGFAAFIERLGGKAIFTGDEVLDDVVLNKLLETYEYRLGRL